MHDESSPTTYRFAMNVPDGGHTTVNPDGSATIYDKDGNAVRQIARPWAFDAAGRPQKTWYTVDENGDLIQHIEPADDALFPILADPMDTGAAAGANVGASLGAQANAPQADTTQPRVETPPAGSDPMAVAAADALNSPSQAAPPADVPADADPMVVAAANGLDAANQPAPAQAAPTEPRVETPPAGSDPMAVAAADALNSPSQAAPPADVPADADPMVVAAATAMNNSEQTATPSTDAASQSVRNSEESGWVRDQTGQLVPATQYTDDAGNPVTEFTDPETGNKTILSVGDYDGQIAEVFDPNGNKILREERYSGGVLDTGASAGTTVRQFDYRTGRELYLNYDAEGRLYNSAYNDDDVNVLLKPDGSLNATLINSDADYDWQQIAQSVPQEFADTSQDQPIVLNKGDEQLTLNADGSTVLANFDTDRALHFDTGETEPNKVTHADGSDLSVGDGLHDFGQGAWDGARSLVGVGPYGAWETWKGFGSGLGTVIMYLPHTMSDGIHGAANMGNPAGYQHPNREDALFQALTGIKPEYIRTSPSYAVGMLAGAGIATAIPGAGGALTKALRPGLRAGEHTVRPPIGEAIDPALRNHGFTPQQFQELMVRPVRPLTPGEIADLPPGTVIPQPLNRTESAVVDSARAAIPPLTPTTPLQKALDPQGGQLANILNNVTPDADLFPLDGVGGSVAALDDVLDLATPRDLINGLALNYPGSGHLPDHAFVLRFTTPQAGTIPNGPLLNELLTPGGLHPGEGLTPHGKSTYPFTGHGFTASPGHIIPEYELDMARMRPGATLVGIAENGSEAVIRVLTEAGQWVMP